MDIKIRQLEIEDLKSGSGFWKTLSNLKPVKEVNYDQAVEAYHRTRKQDIYTFVAVDSKDSQIIGSVSLLIEQKFIRNLGLAGHIEDVVTRKEYEGNQIASQLITQALQKAKELGCYKVILDCRQELVSFYQKFGFEPAEVQMKIYFKKS